MFLARPLGPVSTLDNGSIYPVNHELPLEQKILAVLTREMEMVAKHTATAELSSLLPSLSGNNQVGQSNIVES